MVLQSSLSKNIVVRWSHDDVIKWKHFPRNWPFVRGIHRSPVNSTHKGQWRGALMFSLICVWINDWVIPPFHRGRRVPGHWPESRFVTSGHGPVSYLSSTDEFRPNPTSVPWVSAQTDEFRSSKIVRWQKFNGFKIRHRTFAPMKFPANGGLITHRLRRASSADSDYPPATHLPHSHVMLSSHRRQDKSVIRRPLIGSSSEFDRWGTGSTAH